MIHTIVVIQCDKCGKEEELVDASLGFIESMDKLRKAGWKTGEQKDYCSECNKKLSNKEQNNAH